MNIIELAREAGIKQAVENPSLLMVHELTRFAALVRAAALEEAAQIADAEASVEGIAQRIAEAIRERAKHADQA